MALSPTGRIVASPEGRVLELSRTFPASIDVVWAALTESAQTGRWIGTWSGEAGPGKVVDFVMTAEGMTEPSPVTITACEPPRLLALDLPSPGESWRVRVELSEADGETSVRFGHVLSDGDDVSSIGPGWEYYFDRLLATVTGDEMRPWDDYFPVLQEAYASLG